MSLFKQQAAIPSIAVLTIFYLAMVAWWISIHANGLIDTVQNFSFGIGLGFLTILGGLMGILVSRDWGWFSSRIGKTLIYLSAGFICWGIGTLIIGYFNLALDQSYPYPSIADLAYILSWPLWFIAMVNLSKATGARYQFRNWVGKALAVIIVAFAFLVSYYLLVQVARGGVFEIDSSNYLRLFFDFAYPVGDIVILTSGLLLFGLSFNYLGGALKAPIFIILFGFLLNYLSDIIFTYKNTVGTFYVAGWVDLMYLTAFFALGLGVNLFSQKIVFKKQLDSSNGKTSPAL